MRLILHRRRIEPEEKLSCQGSQNELGVKGAHSEQQ